MSGSAKYIREAAAFGAPPAPPPSNAPPQYADRHRQYLAGRTALFDAARAHLAGDYVRAEVQGLTESFYDWTETDIRLSDLRSPSASPDARTDDVKQILLPALAVDYLPPGAKIRTMGSTWLCVNPANLSGVRATAVIFRCNTSYNSYDCYGNVVSEPIFIERATMLGNDNQKPENLVLMDGYFRVLCQLNDNTRRLGQNRRMILGDKAYFITGFTDFIREFTDLRGSTHLLDFTVRLEEPTREDDVTVHFIAGGRTQRFEATLSGAQTVRSGALTTLLAQFSVNGTPMQGSAECPVGWLWSTSDAAVASVDALGNVTGISPGSATVTATLEQNPSVSASLTLTVTDAAAPEQGSVAFLGSPQTAIRQNTSAVYEAAYFLGGRQTPGGVTYRFSGADPSCYLVTLGTNDDLAASTVGVDFTDMLLKQYFSGELYRGSVLTLENGVLTQTSDPSAYVPAEAFLQDSVLYVQTDALGFNRVMITALRPSPVPLTITACRGDVCAEVTVALEGY